MKSKKIYKFLATALLLLICFSAISAAVFAAGDVATAVENTWTAAKAQIKKVVDNVVFPVLSLILAVLFFVKVGGAYFDYRKHGQFEFTAPAILFVCLLFVLTAPLYIWDII
ncbi:MAG: DUF3852 domain-containing protein [Oscillospiraceae bacterium]|nr:DUF3852 domain-containing protein [Oscillospiraceae bacterium]